MDDVDIHSLAETAAPAQSVDNPRRRRDHRKVQQVSDVIDHMALLPGLALLQSDRLIEKRSFGTRLLSAINRLRGRRALD